MRFTRLSRPILGAGISCLVSCALVSCADDPGDSALPPEEQTDAALPVERDASTATDATDAGAEEKDASRIYPSFDASAPPIDCKSDPCAVSLTTRGFFGYWETPLGRVIARGVGASFCALLRDGTVACWGANDAGQLGRGEDASSWGSPTAMRVPGLAKIAQLDGTCAVDDAGAAWCWSYGPYQNLSSSPVNSLERSPVRLALDPVKKVAVGSFGVSSVTGCAIGEDGGVVCWGANTNAIVSATNVTGNSVVPVTPIALPPGGRARDIAVGAAAVVLMEDGSLLSWGDNPTLGRGTSITPNPYPQKIDIAGIASSADVRVSEGCATAWGAAYCWGAGASTTTLHPITYYYLDNLERARPSPLVLPEPVRQISASGARQGCVVGESGSVYCWGDNTYGQLGDGTKTYAAAPVKVGGLPAAAVEVRAAGDATCALLVSGKIYCWGADQYGQLGNGSLYEPSLVPQEVTLP